MISRQHIWTLEITQSLIDKLQPLVMIKKIIMTHINTKLTIIIIYLLLQNLPNFITRHLNVCDHHMTILRKFGPPLQWNIIVLDIGIDQTYVLQPWYQFLEDNNFSHGDEISFYYRHHEQIWEIIIRRQKNWNNNDSDSD